MGAKEILKGCVFQSIQKVTRQHWTFGGGKANTNFKVYGFARPEVETTNYHTRC